MARLFSPAVARHTGPMWEVGADGWTTFYPSADSRLIHVANAGSNSNDGLSPAAPVQTLKYAQSLTRNNYPDHILLKRGDTFVNGWQNDVADGFGGFKGNGGLNRSGRSRNEPFVVRDYGDLALLRPKIIPTSTRVVEEFITSSGSSCNNLAIQGIEFYAPQADPTHPSFRHYKFTGTLTSGSAVITGINSTANLEVGMILCGPGCNSRTIASIDVTTLGAGQITMNGTTSYGAADVEIDAFFNLIGQISFNGWVGFLYMEDCFFNYTGVAIGQSTMRRDLEPILRRNIQAHSYIPLQLGQGWFMADFPVATRTLRVEENFFYQNGWHPDVAGAESQGRCHNAYCHDVHGPHEFVGNITARAATNGYMQRNGSLAVNNLYLENAYGGTWGTGITPNPLNSNHNVFLQGIDQEQPRLTAVSATSVGTTPASITFAGVPSSTTGASNHATNLYNLDNPGSLVSRAGTMAAGGKTLTLNGAIAAGTRGNGVQPGDRIVGYTAIASGFTAGSAYAIPIANATPGVKYFIGETGPFYVAKDRPIPSWVQVGYRVMIDHNIDNPQIKFSNTTTVTSISTNRLSFTTSEGLLGNLLGGDPRYALDTDCPFFSPQANVVFWDPVGGSADKYPTSFFGPNNIMCNSQGVNSQFGIKLTAASMYADASGNYFYKWCANTANNVIDDGVDSIVSPQALNSNTTVAAYDEATIEGYMASLGLTPTKEAFYAGCFANRRGAYDLRFTAPAVNTYIRGKFGAPEPS
jgi:hypothetical protein